MLLHMDETLVIFREDFEMLKISIAELQRRCQVNEDIMQYIASLPDNMGEHAIDTAKRGIMITSGLTPTAWGDTIRF